MSGTKKRPHPAEKEAEETTENESPSKKTAGCVSAEENAEENRLDKQFFDVPTLDLAKKLLGKLLVRKMSDESDDLLKARIVETEAYLGSDDKASHSYGGKRSGWASNKAMFMAPGTAYVFSVFGKNDCLNVSSGDEGGVVRIRALEPISGLETMETHRHAAGKSVGKPIPTKQLCNGPSRLCQALKISKADFNQKDLSAAESELYFMDDQLEVQTDAIQDAKRIGLPKTAEEWADKLLRFYILENEFVSETS